MEPFKTDILLVPCNAQITYISIKYDIHTKSYKRSLDCLGQLGPDYNDVNDSYSRHSFRQHREMRNSPIAR